MAGLEVLMCVITPVSDVTWLNFNTYFSFSPVTPLFLLFLSLILCIQLLVVAFARLTMWNVSEFSNFVSIVFKFRYLDKGAQYARPDAFVK